MNKTIVGVNPWVEHRNRAVFGDDADLFRPERWLEEDSEQVKTMNRNWIPVSWPIYMHSKAQTVDLAVLTWDSLVSALEPALVATSPCLS